MIAEAAILRARSPIYRDLSDDAAVTMAAAIDLFARDLLADCDLAIDELVETIEDLIAIGACKVIQGHHNGEPSFILEADENVAAQLLWGKLQ